MVSFKFIGGLMAVASFLSSTSLAASTWKSTTGERVAALYVKDDSNGELRFLGNTGNSNAQINQLITQNQDMLEQLRPTSTSNGGTGTGSGIFTGTGTGTGGSGVTPIIINTGGSSANNGAVGGAVTGPSPIAGLLPQIIAQAAVGGTRIGGGGQRRRIVNNRRRSRPANSNRPQIFVIRSRN